MRAFTIRMRKDKLERLKSISKRRGMSLNGLINESVVVLLTAVDAEVHFQLRAERGRGHAERGVTLLSKAQGKK